MCLYVTTFAIFKVVPCKPFLRLYSTWQTLSPPLWTLAGVRSGGGQPSQDFIDPIEYCCPTRPTFKLKKTKHCPCILEGCLTTNPILSAPHLQGLKSNIYVHFQVINKQSIGISSRKWSHQWSMKLTWRS